ncbi:MAG: 2-hydroxyethylphosphonate methyltransferase [Dehalococcoidia bacterium]|nr:2-hydroxyethylphosphonate methyltransferase [Chloroflexota bacterium]MBT9160547.1 2-hydroxyethylphosphonate methyltransferase [Chloroflexota bacterium]
MASRSPENVVDEVEFVINKYGFRNLYFVDNVFTVDKDRTMRILTLMRQRNLKIGFALEARAPTVDKDLIRAMADAGCIGIQFGVESGNPEVLTKIKKGITLQQVDNAVQLCLQYGIRPLCSFIIGHPFDDRETVRDTINYAKKLKRQGALVVFAVLDVYPGTEIFDRRDELGVSIIDPDFSRWTGGQRVLRTKHLSSEELRRLHREALCEVAAI